jgi:hypothetical protein
MRKAPEYVRVRVVRAFCLGGGRDVFPGDVIDLEDHRARQKQREGFVKPIEDDNDENPGKDSGRQPRRGADSKEGKKS